MSSHINLKEWLIDERDIREETLDAFAVTSNGNGSVTFPYPDGEKVRIHRPDGKRVFLFTQGKKPGLFVGPPDPDTNVCFIVEGETDTMRLWQELDGSADCVGISGVEGWSDEFATDLERYEHVFVVLDNDVDYMVQSRVENAWRGIRKALGTKARRVKLPTDVKDICEFFDKYDLDSLRLICTRIPQPGESSFKTIDLTKEPPPVRWVVQDMFCAGDVHLMIGEPGIGKSWLTMALALAVAGNEPEFLGLPVHEHGRVLYIDEENPEDLIFDRFRKLGLTDAAAKNIRYINNSGVRLDKNPYDLIEEAIAYDPVLIVLDSLTRFHTEDENYSGAMANLFAEGIKPLARDSNAAVVLIHHITKTDSNSSFKRARGSGDITAAPDSGFDVRQNGEGYLSIANFKSRRRPPSLLHASIKDTADGHVTIQLSDGDVPF